MRGGPGAGEVQRCRIAVAVRFDVGFREFNFVSPAMAVDRQLAEILLYKMP